MIDSYASIYNLGHAAIRGLFEDEVQVEEKVDGSQFSFGMLDGSLQFRSRSAAIDPDAPEKMFAAGVEAVKAVADKLEPGFVYRGEYLQKPKHNALAYNRIPANHVIVWDVQVGPGDHATAEGRAHLAAELGMEAVPVLASGKVDQASLRSLLTTQSILGGQLIEGVVIKNYLRFGRDKKILVGKFVSDSFKEVHRKTWKQDNPAGKDILVALGDKYRHEARWNKAIQHLAEAGTLDNSPKDIGNLLREVQDDVNRECAEEIKEALYRWARPQLNRSIIRGLPEWYKDKLLQKQFGEVDE